MLHGLWGAILLAHFSAIGVLLSYFKNAVMQSHGWPSALLGREGGARLGLDAVPRSNSGVVILEPHVSGVRCRRRRSTLAFRRSPSYCPRNSPPP